MAWNAGRSGIGSDERQGRRQTLRLHALGAQRRGTFVLIQRVTRSYILIVWIGVITDIRCSAPTSEESSMKASILTRIQLGLLPSGLLIAATSLSGQNWTNIPSYATTLFSYNDTATTEIYTLSLHDALPI